MGKRLYPDWLIARIRAATMAGMRHKLIAKATGASESLIQQISGGHHRPEVPPDPQFADSLQDLFLCHKPQDNQR